MRYKYSGRWMCIILDALDAIDENPQLREGQALFNAAHERFPTATDKVRGTEADCFYRDDRIDDFKRAVEHVWDEQEADANETCNR